MAYHTNTSEFRFDTNLNNESDRWKRGALNFKAPEEGSIFSNNQNNLDGLGHLTSPTGSNYGSYGSVGDDPNKGTDWKGWGGMIGSGLAGLGQLAQGWAAIKGIGVAEDQLGENKRQYNQNYAQQLRAFEGNRTRANTRIDDQNAWKTAQGRKDLGNLIA